MKIIDDDSLGRGIGTCERKRIVASATPHAWVRRWGEAGRIALDVVGKANTRLIVRFRVLDRWCVLGHWELFFVVACARCVSAIGEPQQWCRW